jgi:hypothetical protein
MSKRKVYLVILLILAIAGYFLYHRLMDSKEILLDSKYYKTELDTIKQIRLNLKKK